jgi:hypothetical protein
MSATKRSGANPPKTCALDQCSDQGGLKLNERIVIRTSADIAAIEKGGLDAFLPSAMPFGLIENAVRLRSKALQ